MSATRCTRCGAPHESEYERCQKCRAFEKSHGDKPYYWGEIRAGDRFIGQHGFIWAKDGTLVVLYVESSEHDRLRYIPETQFRARVAGRVENEVGTLLFPALE